VVVIDIVQSELVQIPSWLTS